MIFYTRVHATCVCMEILITMHFIKNGTYTVAAANSYKCVTTELDID